MEKEMLAKLNMDSREEAVSFLKSLWNEAPQPCPQCGGKLDLIIPRRGYRRYATQYRAYAETYRGAEILKFTD